MLFEYAVEPDAIGSSWQQFRYLIEQFGFDRGRLLSRFPKRWEREVIEAAQRSEMGEVRLKSLVSRLQLAKAALVSSGRNYDPGIDGWLANALSQHAREPFHAIIARQNDTQVPAVLVAADIDDTTPLMGASPSWEAARTGADLAAALGPLLKHARDLWFVDPFFDVLDGRYVETLRCCLAAAAAAGNGDATWRIHYREHDRRPPIEMVERGVRRTLAGVIPEGQKITLQGWRERAGGADFHARYFLTERGGVSVEAGFSAEGGHQKVDLHLLGLALCETRREAFGAAPAYDPDGPALEIDASCNVARR
jgi:hypothetical protein